MQKRNGGIDQNWEGGRRGIPPANLIKKHKNTLWIVFAFGVLQDIIHMIRIDRRAIQLRTCLSGTGFVQIKRKKIDEIEPECATCAATLLLRRNCTEITFLPPDIEFAPIAQYCQDDRI